MKTTIVLLVMLSLIALPAFGQTSARNPNTVPLSYYQALFSSKAYADSQIDTSGTYYIGGATRLSLRTTATDSASYITDIDYRNISTGSWVKTASDTVAVVAGGATSTREWVLRDNTVEKLAGVSGQIRIRQRWAASNNGVTTPAYTQLLFWKP